MYKSIDIKCEECGIRVELCNIPSGEPLPDEMECTECGNMSPRLISFNIAKGQIAERARGGEVVGGHIVTKYTGWKDTEKQQEMDTALRRAVKRKDADTANGLAAEMVAMKKTAKKNIGKAKQ